MRIGRLRAAPGPDPPGSSRCLNQGRRTPVPRVLLSNTLAEPAPSGSADTSRLCQGCSHPPRQHPDQAALSFDPPAATGRRRRSLTSTRTNSASRRKPNVSQSRSFGRPTGRHLNANTQPATTHRAISGGLGPARPAPPRLASPCAAPLRFSADLTRVPSDPRLSVPILSIRPGPIVSIVADDLGRFMGAGEVLRDWASRCAGPRRLHIHRHRFPSTHPIVTWLPATQWNLVHVRLAALASN
jgi:hypothetical protein